MIRLANPSDLDAIAEIYEEILAAEDARPVSYTNWQRGKYPTIDTARQALEAGTFYVGEEDGILWGVVNLNSIQLPEYDAIPWSIPAAPEEVGVIHTLCIRPPARDGAWPGRWWPSARRRPADRAVKSFGWTPGRQSPRQPDVPHPGLPLRRTGGVLLHGLCAGEPELLREGPVNPLGRKGLIPLLTVG